MIIGRLDRDLVEATAADEELAGRIRAHLASTGLALSVYQLARVLGAPRARFSRSRGWRGPMARALAELERRGEVVRVVEAADECDRRLVTRWRAA